MMDEMEAAEAAWKKAGGELRTTAVVLAERLHRGHDVAYELAEYRAVRSEWTEARNRWLDMVIPTGTAEAAAGVES